MRKQMFMRTVALLIVLLAASAPAAAAQVACTTRATYIADVTYRDNTVVPAGTTFIKTWRIRNDGSCAWGPGQPVDSLEMVGGSTLGTATRVPINNLVRRGQTADISIKLAAPAQDGTYRSEWKFRRNNGLLFGLGASGVTPFYVQIVVRSGGQTSEGERIQFPPGATVASVQGRVSDTGRNSYVLAARAGQPMRVALVSANPGANFSVVGVTDGQPYKRVDVGEPWFYLLLPSTQDYRIDVRVASGAGTASYVLAIAIAP